MPILLPVDHLLLSFPRAPRAQFFANRAVSHVHSLHSFDEIIDQQLMNSIASRHHPAQEQQGSGSENLGSRAY
jgi:hypothetical protein